MEGGVAEVEEALAVLAAYWAQTFLWAFQWLVWQSREQYWVVWHFAHRFRLSTLEQEAQDGVTDDMLIVQVISLLPVRCGEYLGSKRIQTNPHSRSEITLCVGPGVYLFPALLVLENVSVG